MRVLVCGGRDFADFPMLSRVLDALHAEFAFSSLIHGGATGADQFSGRWARQCGVKVTVFPANWKQYGLAAGAKRNQQMLDEGAPALVVAFPGGAGTRDMKQRARRAGVKVIEVSKDGTLTGK